MRFTERAQRIISMAQEEAKRCEYDAVEPLHLLAAAMALGEGTACRILIGANLSHSKIKERAISEHPKRGSALMGEIPFSPKGKRVIELAVEEAQDLAHSFIGTEHFLLGLLRDESCSRFLKEYGLELAGVRQEILKLVGKGSYPLHTATGIASASHLGEQLMIISTTRDVTGVLVVANFGEEMEEPGIVILLEEGADLDKTHKALEDVLPRVRHLSFKKPGRKPVSWVNGQWEENQDAEQTLIF